MPSLVLGPILRYLGEREATLWVETDSDCRVSVLGASTPTFEVEGHHYALVHVTGLEPGAAHPYSVELDGECAWPAGSEFPPSVIRTLERSPRARLVFGSCRIALPHEPPYTCPQAEDRRGHGIDALRAFALRMAWAAPDTWPAALLMLGDQIYSDDLSPTLLAATEGRVESGAAGRARGLDLGAWFEDRAVYLVRHAPQVRDRGLADVDGVVSLSELHQFAYRHPRP